MLTDPFLLLTEPPLLLTVPPFLLTVPPLLLIAPPLLLESCCMPGCQSTSAGAARWTQVRPHAHAAGVAHMYQMPYEGVARFGPTNRFARG